MIKINISENMHILGGKVIHINHYFNLKSKNSDKHPNDLNTNIIFKREKHSPLTTVTGRGVPPSEIACM